MFLNDGSGNFTPQMTFTTGDRSKPLSVVLSDFNNDTHLDLAVTNYDGHNIGIFYGYGNGSFASLIAFSTGASRPVSIAVGDFNHDHWMDIVVTNNGTNSIGVLFGSGNGSFGNLTTYATGYDSFPNFVVTADFNSDHYLDIVVANYGTDNVGVFMGYGNGSFATQITYSTNLRSIPLSIAVNDFNNDGYLDIAVANSGTNTVGIFLGYGNGRFRSQTTYSTSPGSRPSSIIIGDFNQDNQLDIAVSNYETSNISISIGYGNGSFATPTMHSTGIASSPFGMTVGDFDNDNKSDIAVANFATNNIFLLIGYTMMHSQSPSAYSTELGSLPYQIAIGDFDNDTKLDLAVVNYGTANVGIFLGCGNGSFQEQITYSTGDASNPYALSVNDLDEDYRLDIITANSNTQSLGILYGYGDGKFETLVIYSTGDSSSPKWITVNDFNKDKHLDIAFIDDVTETVNIILGYGNRTFGELTKYSTGSNTRPISITSGDVNDDGRLDIVVANYGTNSIAIFLGSGNGKFALFTIYSTGDNSLPSMLTIADLNNDNQLDITVANPGTNSIGVFFGYGNGSFGPQQIYLTGSSSSPYWISVADLNNDHWLDLAVANYNTQNVGVFLGNSQEYLGSEATYPTGFKSQPYSIAVGDFNKDNRLDIAVAAYGTNNIAILLGHPNKDTTNKNWIASDVPILLGDYYADFVTQRAYSTGSSPRPYSVAIGDLNNDDKNGSCCCQFR